ncbi:MAG TPA: hypothetical protein PKA05_23615, partial [Roseiflexaceae bacterium]|nr:hypothetical protein [Roseiflexaceae bacterium]HMP43382.1 hypothetical protein [Roseiflexaceae bacterium]
APAVVPQPQPANPEPVIIAPPAGDNTGNTAGTDTNGNGTVSLTPTVAEEIATSVTVVASVTPPATATATPTTTPTATPVTFGVELRVEGTSGRISILYSTPLETERLDAVRLPWSLSLRAERGAQLSVFVDNASELGDVSCTILVENVVIVTVVDLLPFGEVECAAIVP